VLIAAYDRRGLEQTGSGHFSPLAGYHPRRDLALILDVARFKYPPHWVPVERLWEAMQSVDETTGKPRGYLVLRSRGSGVALGYTLSCASDGWGALAERLQALVAELGKSLELERVVSVIAPLTAHIQLRVPQAPLHVEALEQARAQLRLLPVYAPLLAAIGPERAELGGFLLCALSEHLPLQLQAAVAPSGASLLRELQNLKAQLSAIATLTC